MSYEIAEDDELPHELTSYCWNQPIGLMITAIATLVIANTLNLENISTGGSVGFLLIFAIVNFVGYKLAIDIARNRTIPLLGFVCCSVALIALLTQQYSSNKLGVIIAVSIVMGCFLLEWGYKRTAVTKV